MKSSLVKEAVIATFIILGLTYLINFFPFKFEFTNPIKQEFQDFDLYDLYYSGNKDISLANDTNIVVVQVADGRSEIARQMMMIKQMQPAVIGLDILFLHSHAQDVKGDNLLLNAVNDEKVVPAYRIVNSSSPDSLIATSIIPDSVLRNRGGYVNFTGDNFSVVRTFQPFLKEAPIDSTMIV